MQTTLPLTPGNPLRSITGLARQIALPGEHAPLRFPSFPALERTAVMGFNAPATLDVDVDRSTAITVFRQAAYPVWADRKGHFLTAVDYRVQAAVHASNTATENLTLAATRSIAGWSTTARMASPSTCGLTTSAMVNVAPAWALLGVDTLGPEFTYVPAGCVWSVVFGSQSAASTDSDLAIVDVDVWSSPKEYSSFQVPLTVPPSSRAGMSTPIGSNGAWIRVRSVNFNSTVDLGPNYMCTVFVSSSNDIVFTGSSTTMGIVTSTYTTQGYYHVPLATPTEFANSTLPWFATRVTAAALLGTNVTQVLNKGGTVLAGRVSPAVQNAWQCTRDYVNGLHPAEKAFLPLETGVYTYCPPSTDLVFFADYTLNTTGGAQMAPLFRLDNDALYNKIFLAPGSVAETMACTITWHVEFRTSSALFQIGLSAMTLESLHAAQLVLAESGFFFENPEHDNLLSKVISTAKKYAPSVVGMVNPAAGKMLQSLVAKLGNNRKAITPKPGPSKPATTSADKSGINGPKKGKPKGKKAGKKK